MKFFTESPNLDPEKVSNKKGSRGTHDLPGLCGWTVVGGDGNRRDQARRGVRERGQGKMAGMGGAFGRLCGELVQGTLPGMESMTVTLWRNPSKGACGA